MSKTAEVNSEGLTYKDWMAAADRQVMFRCGLWMSDLPDTNTYDAWQEGQCPCDHADELLAEEGFPFED